MLVLRLVEYRNISIVLNTALSNDDCSVNSLAIQYIVQSECLSMLIISNYSAKKQTPS